MIVPKQELGGGGLFFFLISSTIYFSVINLRREGWNVFVSQNRVFVHYLQRVPRPLTTEEKGA